MRELRLERAAAALEVVLCSGFPTQLAIIAILSMVGLKPTLPGGAWSPAFVFALTLLDTILLVGLVFFFIRSRGESARELLFGARPPGREALLGLLIIPVSFAIVIVVLLIVQLIAPALRNVPHNPLQDLLRSPVDTLIFLFVVTVAGGVREEVQRGFILRRFEQFLGGGPVGLVIFSIVFSLGHLEQGRDVALATGILGFYWGAIYLRRRSILGPMIGHAGFDLAQVAKYVIFRG